VDAQTRAGAGRQDAMAGISLSPELIDDAACELIGISPERAGEYALALAADGLELPEGWSASDPYRGLVGWDVIMVAPRSLSILRGDLVDSWFSRREYRLSVELADPDTVECDPDLEQTYWRQEQLAQAHVRAAKQAAGELARLLDAGAPRVLDHPLDSEGNLLQHTHLVLGAHRRDGYPLAPGRMEAVARWVIGGYYRRLRELTGGLCAPYRWGRPAADGRVELVGLPEELVDAFAGRFRPLREVGACDRPLRRVLARRAGRG
jgi:hypothetical protein